MKILNVSDVGLPYPAYLTRLHERFPELTGADYRTQHRIVTHDHFAWAMPFNHAMAPFGYDVWNVDRGIESMQRAWARENGCASLSPDDIVVAQAKAFRPDVLFYDLSDPHLLRRLRAELPSVRLVLGWVGSPLTLGKTWDQIDLLLTCAPESVPRLEAMGVRAIHVDHSFDPSIIDRLRPTERPIDMSFIGSIVRRSAFHLGRERLLLRLREEVPLTIYSPTLNVTARDYAKVVVAATAHGVVGGLRRTGLLAQLRGNPKVERLTRIASPPRLPLNRRLARGMRPAVFGLEYFQVLKDSGISLNVHADTSPTHASNMRLFEATGVGSCLLTDWKTNIASLYEPDREVVVYRSPEEAADKARWLLAHPVERRAIAEAGQRRTLRSHTFAHRAAEIDAILRRELSRRAAS